MRRLKSMPTYQQILRAAFAIGLSVLSGSALADYTRAAKAYEAKDYAAAFSELKSLAELGHAPSQYSLSAMYLRGEGVKQDVVLAYGWAKLAADSANARAIELEARIRPYVDAASIDKVTSDLNQFTEASIKQRLLPNIIAKSDYQNWTPPRGIAIPAPLYPWHLLEKGEEGFVLFDFYVEKDGSVRDVNIVDAFPKATFDATVRDQVLKWRFKPATRDGLPSRMWLSTAITFNTNGLVQGESRIKTIANLAALADSGEPNAQYLYGLILSGHPDFVRPWSEALPWMQKAAQGGSAGAQYRVGLSLMQGRSCVQDKPKGLDWLLRSAQQDYADAQVELGKLALREGPDRDTSKGVFWLEQAAKTGNSKAKKYLAAVLGGSIDEKLRDTRRAIELADAAVKENPSDIVAREIKAMALANAGQFAAAVSLQKKVITAARGRKWDLAEPELRLASYRSGKPWYGELLAF